MSGRQPSSSWFPRDFACVMYALSSAGRSEGRIMARAFVIKVQNARFRSARSRGFFFAFRLVFSPSMKRKKVVRGGYIEEGEEGVVGETEKAMPAGE